MSTSRRAVVVNPPLFLSPEFIDTPYLVGLGAYQAAAVLAQSDFEVRIVDAFAAPAADLTRNGPHVWLGEPRSLFLERLQRLEAELLVINASPFLLAHLARPWLRELVSAVPAAAGIVVLAEMVSGGMHYLEVDAQELLAELPRAQLVLRYEGELLLAALAAEMQAGQAPGRGFRENRVAFPLYDLPPPAFHLMEREPFFAFFTRVLSSPWRRAPFPAAPTRTLPLSTARGCPYDCLFCSSNPGLEASERRARAVPIERIARWIGDWVQSFGIERLVLLDDILNLNGSRFDELLTLFERRALRVEIPNGLRADLLTEEQVVRLGPLTSGIKVSLESASSRVQKEILGKNLDPAAVERVAAWCARHHVPLEVHCMIGIPGETRGEILSTLELAARLCEEHGARPLLQLATPLPGTRLDALCRAQRLLVREPDDLHSAFQEGLIRTDEFDPSLLGHARQALARRIGAPSGRKVIVNLTYRCNNHCVFCAVGDRPRQDADPAAVGEALRRYRAEGYELLDFDGGEPTLHQELLSLIREARGLGYRRIAVITNGRRASYVPFANALASTGVDEVLVSLHAADSKLMAALTGVDESLSQTKAGIRNLLTALGSDKVAVNTTLVHDNVAALEPLAALLAELGVQRWNLQVVTPFGRAHAALLPSTEELTRQLTALLDRPSSGMQIQVINCPPCLLPGHEEVASADFGKAFRHMVFVGAEGENLLAFLAQRRSRTCRCADCVFAVACPGEYVFDETHG